jgi:hypothetical protein
MITELRRYRIKADRLDSWIAFFEEAARQNEQHGMPVEFSGVDRSTSDFYYLRSFTDEADREARKASFYGSSWWLEREAFAMSHVIEYEVTFLDTAFVRRDSGLASQRISLDSEQPGSRGDAPPDGWAASTGRLFAPSARNPAARS